MKLKRLPVSLHPRSRRGKADEYACQCSLVLVWEKALIPEMMTFTLESKAPSHQPQQPAALCDCRDSL